MQRFSELSFKGGSLVKSFDEKFIKCLDKSGAFCIEGSTKVPLNFQVAGAMLEARPFYGGELKLEDTLQVFKACKKDKFVYVKNRTFLTYNAKALYYLSHYGATYGNDIVESDIRDLCSGFFTMANGDAIGGEFEGKKIVFIEDKKRGYLKDMLGDVVFWLARAVTANNHHNVLKGILPFSVNRAKGFRAAPEKVAYAAAIVLNRKLCESSETLSFINVLLDSIEETLKHKPSPYRVTALTTFVYVIDSFKVPITLKLRTGELKEKAIERLLSDFSAFNKFVNKKCYEGINSLADLDVCSSLFFPILGYDELRALSPITWYSDRIRESDLLQKMMNAVKLPEDAKEEIIKDIAKCVM